MTRSHSRISSNDLPTEPQYHIMRSVARRRGYSPWNSTSGKACDRRGWIVTSPLDANIVALTSLGRAAMQRYERWIRGVRAKRGAQ